MEGKEGGASPSRRRVNQTLDLILLSTTIPTGCFRQRALTLDVSICALLISVRSWAPSIVVMVLLGCLE